MGQKQNTNYAKWYRKTSFHASRTTLSKTEIHYLQTEKEALAIICLVKDLGLLPEEKANPSIATAQNSKVGL